MSLPSIKPYKGALSPKSMSKKDRQAYSAFCNLKHRSKKFGLPTPTMNAREFMGWWLAETRKKNFVRPSCGRIDHSKGYSWQNMEVQECNENARESSIRNAPKKQRLFGHRVIARDPKTKKIVATFISQNEASKFFRVSQSYINYRMNGKYKFTGRWGRVGASIPFILERGDK